VGYQNSEAGNADAGSGIKQCHRQWHGTGAISSFGTPFVLQVNEPTYVDVQAALAWSTSLQTDIKSIFKVGSLDRPGQRRELPNGFHR
jgi:uncharacterized protein (AIM24 family)